MCLRNLFRRRGRTLLCVIGVALGIMLIIAIGATTSNYVHSINEMNVFYRGKVVVIPRGSIFIQAVSVGGFIQENTLDELRDVEGAKAAVPMIFILGLPRNEGVLQIVPSNITIGIPEGNWSVLTGSFSLKQGGKWPSASFGKSEVVVGAYFSIKYSVSVGSEIEINNEKLEVVGILDVPSSSTFLGGTIITPLITAQEVYNYQKLISMVVVEPEEGVTEQELSDRIEAEVSGTGALTGNERNEIIAPILRDIELWSFGIGSVVSCINMVLVMVVSIMNVFERRKELATLDALGIPMGSIVRVVVTEIGLIGLFGWIIGTPLGIVATLLIAYYYTFSPLSIIISNMFRLVPLVMMLQTMIATLALSCVAGIISTLTIARKNIVELLRAEY